MMLFSGIWADASFADNTAIQGQQIVAPDAADGDLFGFAMATDGWWLAVGAKFADTFAGEDGGAVYVYRKQADGQWAFVQKLVPLHGDNGDEFGESVALWHNHLVVGARSALNGNGSRSGVAYVFKYRGHRRGWVETAMVEPSDGSDDDEFGRSVAVGPGRLMVGARFADNAMLADTGAVYVYRYLPGKGQWALEQKLVDPEGQPGDEFGRAIAYDISLGGRLAVGSREARGTGAVFLFSREIGDGTWQVNQVLTPVDGQARDYFGQSLAMHLDLLVVGARDADTQARANTGAAYVYRLDCSNQEWMLEQKLEPPSGKKKDQFGFALAINSFKRNRIAVSARRADTDVGPDTGIAYTFAYDRRSGQWILDKTNLPEDLLENDEFGQCLAMDPFNGAWLAVGADQSSLAGYEDSGAVYIYDLGFHRK
ncbi:MAG: hypothetical protein PVI89_17605 [Desulfobacteraceae bacterium]|jgi:hypothetical protein